MAAPTREFLMQLLKDVRIRGPQLDELVERAFDADYWRGLVPDLSINGVSPLLECESIARATSETAIHSERTNGYFHLPGVLSSDGTRRLNHAIDAVVAAGWPPAFLFVYDEAWQAARAPGLSAVIEAVLGPGYSQICHVWVHAVRPIAGATGWNPHTDGGTDSGSRGHMSIWLGLTDATVDNGCMHVIPRIAVSSTPDLISRFRQDDGQFSTAEVSSLLHASHTLVTAPGDALGWGFDVIRYRKFEPAIDRFVEVARAIKARLE